MAAKISTKKENVVFEEKLQLKLCSFLDENFPDDLSNVRQCLERMEKEREALEKQLAISMSKKDVAPLCVGKTIEEANLALENVDKIQCNLEELNSCVDKHNDKVDDVIQQLDNLNNTVRELENLSNYIKWLQRVEDLSTIIHQDLETGSLKKAISELLTMKRLVDDLQGTSCQHLNKFLVETLKYWNKILVDKLSKEFNEILKVLKWPFTSGSTAPSLAANSVVFQTLENLFLMLLQVSDINGLYSLNGEQMGNISLPMDLLLQPLRKRFKYHFYGKRQTNNLEKPEWFYTQILNWLRDHEDFIDATIQPIIDKAETTTRRSAQVQFTEGLLQLVVDKMEHNFPLVLNDETLFSHFIDETLLFDQELRNAYDLSQVKSSCLEVLAKQPCFAKWLALEKKYAMENVQSLLSSEKAWNPRYEDAADVDDLKVPECVETFVSLLVGITDRYRNLPGEENQILFVNIQLDLVYFFTASLDEIKCSSGPLTLCFLFIINSTNYLATILQDWSEQAMFLKLYYCKTQLSKKNGSEQSEEMQNRDELNVLSNDHDDFDNCGTLFEEAIERLKTLQNNMIAVLVKHVAAEFKMKSESYKKESWHSLPSQKELAITSLSSSLCDMIVYLRDILDKLKQELVECLFTCFWKQVAEDLSEFLFNEIVLKSHFNEGGAAQLKFDIHKNLFVLFGQFTAKPENYFRKLKEATILLNLMPGSAVLLKETVEENKRKPNREMSREALDELGVYTLSFHEVLNVLSSRINWSK